MAAQLKEDGRTPSLQLVRQKDLAKVARDCKEPPKPSAALIKLFAKKEQ